MNAMNGLATALVLAVASAAAYAGAAVLQERVAGAGRERGAGVWAALTRGSWWLSVALNAAGAALHVLALRYGPLTLIQPLGALTLVLALPLQAALRRRAGGAGGGAGRRVGAARWRGAGLTVAGLAGVLVLVRGSGHGHVEVLAPVQVLGTVAATAAALVALGAAARGAGPRAAGVTYATAAGIAFGAGSVLTQTVAVRPGLDAFTVLTGLAVAALAPAGLMLSQAAYRGGLGAPLATATLVNPAVSAAVGLTLLGEQLSGGVPGAAAALAAAALATRGVVLLSHPDPSPHPTPPPTAPPARTTPAATPPAPGLLPPTTPARATPAAAPTADLLPPPGALTPAPPARATPATAPTADLLTAPGALAPEALALTTRATAPASGLLPPAVPARATPAADLPPAPAPHPLPAARAAKPRRAPRPTRAFGLAR